jgi:hypothetical protein
LKSGNPQNQPKIFQIKVRLLETSPIVWRTFLISSNVTLHRLHLVLQDVMGWYNYHLYRFQVGSDEYGEPNLDNDFYELDFKNSKRAKLGNIIKEKNSIFLYEYDFGDGWEHQLLVEDILETDPEKQYPVCIAGENACPREDSGGTHGYAEMMEIIQNPAHEEYRSTKTWLGKGFNPRKFDIESVNKRLSKMHLK